jgi:hypothetical protein
MTDTLCAGVAYFRFYLFLFVSMCSVICLCWLAKIMVMDIGRRTDLKNSKFCFNASEGINGSDIK